MRAVHRMAARAWTAAGRWPPGRSAATPGALGHSGARSVSPRTAAMATGVQMAEAEAARPDPIDAVAIVTPNHLHHGPARAFLDAGIAVICDKPLTTRLADAVGLAETVARTGIPFVLTHNYSGYAMVRQMRAMVAAGTLGSVGWCRPSTPRIGWRAHCPANKQAEWRGDPRQAGPGGALGDIATHAYQLATFVVGATADQVSAGTSRFIGGTASRRRRSASPALGRRRARAALGKSGGGRSGQQIAAPRLR